MRRLQTSDTIDRNKAMGTAHRSTSAWVSDHWLAGAATAPWREERFMSDLLSKHLSATVTSVAGQTHAGAFRLATHSQCIRRANEMAGTSTAATDPPKRRKCRMCGREKICGGTILRIAPRTPLGRFAPPRWSQATSAGANRPRRRRLVIARHGATYALSSDVRLSPPGLGSLHVRFASPSMASLAPIARSRAQAAPCLPPSNRISGRLRATRTPGAGVSGQRSHGWRSADRSE